MGSLEMPSHYATYMPFSPRGGLFTEPFLGPFLVETRPVPILRFDFDMIPDHAPFLPQQRQSISALLAGLSPLQRFWLGGFLSSTSVAQSGEAAPPSASAGKLTVLYGTESGNAEKLADLSAKEAKKRGLQVKVVNMADVSPSMLAKVDNLIVIVSTWGEGDPPESAGAFYKALPSTEVDLAKLKFSVCALGDTAYEKFCQTGKDIDAWLEARGATRVVPREDCDVSYQEPHKKWLEAVLNVLACAPEFSAAITSGLPAFFLGTESAAVEYGRDNPFKATLAEKVRLTDMRSGKETWHYGLSIEDSGISYEPGDALAVVPENAPDVVDGVLAAAKLSDATLRTALLSEYDVTTLSRNMLEKLAAVSPSAKLSALLAAENKGELKSYLYGRWIEDALRDFASDGLSAEQLRSLLRPLPQRLYSIASSLAAFPDEVHLTVASVRYESNGRQRKGVASTYLADLVDVGGSVSVYAQANRNFRLPTSSETPIIMVGPGTGVAPFRAFTQARAAAGATGKSWLFFGDQHYTHDFLYQLEWQEHLANGSLSRLDVAFSRDQPEKVYVQHKMLDRAAELYAWLQEGAHFYVCGDASRMAHDVHETLVTIFEKQGGKSREAAEAEVEELRKARRYQKDVY